jgi:histidinol phosphatase-like PHP family hydrolase
VRIRSPHCLTDNLKLSLLRLALKEGTRISFGTEAHHPWQLAFMEFALAAAVLAGFEPHQIINFLSIDELRKWVSQISQPH